MRDIFLLGAGASVDAGLPDSVGLTGKILEAFKRAPRWNTELRPVLEFVIAGLAFQKTVIGADPASGIDIEALFNALELLARKDELTIRPFINGWHPKVDDLGRTRYAMQRGKPLVDAVKRIIAGDSFADAAIAGALEQYLTERNNVSARVFRDACQSIVQALSDIVWIRESHQVEYLTPLCDVAAKQDSVTVATLNYDNAVELAGSARNVPLSTGIDVWTATGRIDQPVPGLLLLKLHGSIDWEIVEKHEDGKHRTFPQRGIRVLASKPVDHGMRPALLFGQGNKLTVEGPFLELLRRFQVELDQADRLTIVGYSFRDDHVNACIAYWLNGLSTRTVRIIAPTYGRSSLRYDHFASKLLHLVNSGRLEGWAEGARSGLTHIK